jgi:ubiquinone/menaquinone biosynthesis C-methylase UbiE
MPTMYEIYDNHSFEYDELVRFEDHKKNLPRTLHSLFDFNNKSVIELGVGTGRLTRQYVRQARRISVFDRSEHMLDKARINLESYKDKIDYAICDNNDISTIDKKADFVLEGWSFGHTVFDFIDNAEDKIDEMVSSTMAMLNPGGTVIFLETLGTDTETAQAPADFLYNFYSRLEKKHFFKRVEISTDYKFETVEEASRISGFFFGPEMGENIRKKGSPIIKEYTGLWYINL